jgi:hypothetical protein
MQSSHPEKRSKMMKKVFVWANVSTLVPFSILNPIKGVPQPGCSEMVSIRVFRGL